MVRASSSQNAPFAAAVPAASRGSSAQASASYQGSTYGQANSQASTTANATLAPGSAAPGSARTSSTASSTATATAPALMMSVAAVPATTRWTPLRITRHGDPIDTRPLSRDSWCHMAGPPMASAALAVAANPAASAASGGPVRRPAGRGRSTSATASPTPTSTSETLTANPSPTSTPASAARLRERAVLTRGDGPPEHPVNTATAATAKKTACPSTCAPAMSSCSSSGLAAQSRAARSWRAGSRRVMRCSSRAVPANAARLARPSTNTVSRAEVPPISAASPCTPVASGP